MVISRSGGGFGPPAAASVAGNGTISSAILFPSNGDGSVSDVVFRLSGANLPDIVPLTLLWKLYPVQQASYYTTFFHSRADGVLSEKYFGCHPYPQGGSSGTVHNWEISIEGGDVITDANSNDTTVTKGQWHSQAASTRVNGAQTTVDFYWDIRTDIGRRVSYTTSGGALVNATNSPALSFGDAPWSANGERMSGRFRGLQIYTEQISEANIQALEAMEDDAAVLAKCSQLGITSLWYLNMNPTPSDITDKSGNGRNPSWLSSDHGTLWTP